MSRESEAWEDWRALLLFPLGLVIIVLSILFALFGKKR